jgi:hypothetical protein
MAKTCGPCRSRPAKRKLAQLVRNTGLHRCEHLHGDGTEIFEHDCKLGCEGLGQETMAMIDRAAGIGVPSFQCPEPISSSATRGVHPRRAPPPVMIGKDTTQMGEDTSKALLDELRQFKADVEARRKRHSTVLLVIASPFIALATYFVVFVVSELSSSTQYYATSIGLSISECESFMRTLGGPPLNHVGKCSERVPK